MCGRGSFPWSCAFSRLRDGAGLSPVHAELPSSDPRADALVELEPVTLKPSGRGRARRRRTARPHRSTRRSSCRRRSPRRIEVGDAHGSSSRFRPTARRYGLPRATASPPASPARFEEAAVVRDRPELLQVGVEPDEGAAGKTACPGDRKTRCSRRSPPRERALDRAVLARIVVAGPGRRARR